MSCILCNLSAIPLSFFPPSRSLLSAFIALQRDRTSVAIAYIAPHSDGEREREERTSTTHVNAFSNDLTSLSHHPPRAALFEPIGRRPHNCGPFPLIHPQPTPFPAPTYPVRHGHDSLQSSLPSPQRPPEAFLESVSPSYRHADNPTLPPHSRHALSTLAPALLSPL